MNPQEIFTDHNGGSHAFESADRLVFDFDPGVGPWHECAQGLHWNREVPIQATIVVDLPKRFYEDHRQRDLIGGIVEKELAKKLRVRLDVDAFMELKSDADYYAGMQGEDAWTNGALCSSARATLAALAKAPEFPCLCQGPPADVSFHGEGWLILNPMCPVHGLHS